MFSLRWAHSLAAAPRVRSNPGALFKVVTYEGYAKRSDPTASKVPPSLSLLSCVSLDRRVVRPNTISISITMGPASNGGLVEGNILARECVVAGDVQGSIEGEERVELHSTAIVRGDLTSPNLLVHEGGVLVGRLRVGKSAAHRREDRSEPTQPRPISPPRAAPSLQEVAAAG